MTDFSAIISALTPLGLGYLAYRLQAQDRVRNEARDESKKTAERLATESARTAAELARKTERTAETLATKVTEAVTDSTLATNQIHALVNSRHEALKQVIVEQDARIKSLEGELDAG